MLQEVSGQRRRIQSGAESADHDERPIIDRKIVAYISKIERERPRDDHMLQCLLDEEETQRPTRQQYTRAGAL